MINLNKQHDINKMKNIKLFIANKRYSSWSLRPWILFKEKDILFEEKLVPLDFETGNQRFKDFNPAGKVPAIAHGDLAVWDSLAIMEYVAELYPEKNLWPKDPKRRAHARSIVAEMHSGFVDLRNECPMNMCREPSKIDTSDGVKKDVQRIESIWVDCLEKYRGPFLFGDFSIADAMFAPVVNRLYAYDIDCNEPSTKMNCDAMKSLDAWQAWQRDANEEPWVIVRAER